jgi:NAD-dependent dihydropyrimidine dehydrogenase PreA subunit
MTIRRKIIHIDEEKCDGCGLCVPSCAEGAIQVIAGKARLVSDVYCDGLGACLGECPQGAIAIIERDADAFDEEAAREHAAVGAEKHGAAQVAPRACPGAAVRDLSLPVLPQATAEDRHSCLSEPVQEDRHSCLSEPEPSALSNWPVQLHLVPPNAPFLNDAEVLLVADCVPVALPDFHRRFLQGRPVLIGCPKLDDAKAYVQKLADMLRVSSIRSLTVVHMEVPCCTGIVRIAEAAVRLSGREVPIDDVTVSIRGKVLD